MMNCVTTTGRVVFYIMMLAVGAAFASGCNTDSSDMLRESTKLANAVSETSRDLARLEGILARGMSDDARERKEQIELITSVSVRLPLKDYSSAIEASAIGLLGHRDAQVREAALMLLRKAGGQTAASAAAKCASSTIVADEKKLAIEVLGAISGQEKTLIKILQDESDLQARIWAAQALGDLSCWAASNPLSETYVTCQEDALKQSILIALGEIGDRACVPLLIHELADENALIASAAARALIGAGDERAVDPLLGVLRRQNIHPDIQFWAECALDALIPEVYIADSRVPEPILNAIRNGTYRTDGSLRTMLRNAAGAQEMVTALTRIARSNMRDLAPDILTALQGDLGHDSVVWHTGTSILARWGYYQGLYAVVSRVTTPQNSDSSISILRARMGRNAYGDTSAWVVYLNEELLSWSKPIGKLAVTAAITRTR